MRPVQTGERHRHERQRRLPVEGPDGEGIVEFRVSSNGSAVRELMYPGTEHEMTNMYTLEGNTLVMTHYCAGGNQPHMRASKFENGRLAFEPDGVSDLADTWLWDGSSWVDATPPGDRPAPRDRTAMAFDASRGRVVLFGGERRNLSYDDVWEWDGVEWSQVDTAVPQAIDAYYAAFGQLPVRDQVRIQAGAER